MWADISPGEDSAFTARAAHSCDIGSDGRVYVFGGWNGKQAFDELLVLESGNWRKLEPVDGVKPRPRNNHASCTASVGATSLFVHGGHDGSVWLDDFHVFDFSLLQWREVVPSRQRRPAARACHSLSRVDRRLFLFGGFDGQRCFGDMEIFDLDANAWLEDVSVSGQLPAPRNAHTMTAVGKNLLLIFGHSGLRYLGDVYLFDTARLEWQFVTCSGTPPSPLRGHSANLCLNGKFVVCFGGFDGRRRGNHVHLLELPGNNNGNFNWSKVESADDHTDAPNGRQRHSASLVSQNKLLVVGGFDGAKWLGQVWTLDLTLLPRDARNHGCRKFVHDISALLLDAATADVTLLVDGTKFPCHKAILAARSTHFRAMLFSAGMRETAMAEIPIHGWSKDAFTAMLEFLYSVKSPTGNFRLLLEVLRLADHLILDALKEDVEQTLLGLISEDDVLEIFQEADCAQAPLLKATCLDFIVENFERVTDQPGFDALSGKPNLLLEITKAVARRNSRKPLAFLCCVFTSCVNSES